MSGLNKLFSVAMISCDKEGSIPASALLFAIWKPLPSLQDCRSTRGFQPSQDQDQFLKLYTVCQKVPLINTNIHGNVQELRALGN